jgi:hypothetical protein
LSQALTAQRREALRVRVILRSLLPLLKVVYADRPEWARRLGRTRAIVQFDVAYTPVGAHVLLGDGQIDVVPGLHPDPTVSFSFKDMAGLVAFFTGKPGLPRVRGALRHPLLVARMLWFLTTLRVLTPEARPRRPEDRALYVKLVLYLATHALSQMNKAGHPDVVALLASSPERVYQWTVKGPAEGPVEGTAEETGVSAYLRVHQGKSKAGRGVYARRRPFVQYTFPTVEGAYRVFTTTRSQMESVMRGHVKPEGSPEYSRKISILIQKVDELFTGG